MAKYDDRGYISELDDGEIFVFGRSEYGARMAGVAMAVVKFGAIYRAMQSI